MQPTDFSTSRNEILSRHQKSDSDLQNDLIILREWMKKQPHLPVDKLGDGFLEVQLLKNKFSSNESYSYFYDDYPTAPSKEASSYIPIPKLTENYERIIIGKIYNPEKWELARDIANGLILREFLSRYDYNDGEIFVVDYSNCPSSTIFSVMRANVLADALAIALKGHSSKIKQLHIISKVLPFLLNLSKPLVPAKLYSRIFAHESIESFKEKFAPCYLPKDYGGELKSLGEMRVDMDRMYSEHREELIEYVNTKSCEEKRLLKSNQEMQGTFRNLKID
ncbi:hypothetical protein HHI36_000051 [Cryptolaemus montrouzieri]|uniref:CRAL-TRIO domain-containing protein n=1 Tax=Cryptolaemus montrouzieri TaxID=559131 RepID=A0ABD2P3J6_9CUCU